MRAVVQVETHQRPPVAGVLRRRQNAATAAVRQRRGDAGQMQKLRVREVVPVDFVRMHFADGGVFAVVDDAGRQRRRGGLGEKQRRAKIPLPPDDRRDIHAQRAIFPRHASSHGRVRQGGDPRAFASQSGQRGGGVAFGAHDMQFKRRRVFQPTTVRRGQADSGLAQGGKVKLRIGAHSREGRERVGWEGVGWECFLCGKDGGGGGSRTPVRKSYANGDYTLSPAIVFFSSLLARRTGRKVNDRLWIWPWIMPHDFQAIPRNDSTGRNADLPGRNLAGV